MKRRFPVLLAMGLAVLASAGPLGAQSSQSKPSTGQPPKRVTAQDLALGRLRVTGRVHVGETVPDFTAVSSSGREVTISRLRGDWLVLLFAAAREDFRMFREVHESLRETGAVVLGVCKEKPQRLRTIAERDSLPFELLADDTGDVSAVYGLYDIHRRSTVPGFVLVDRQGVVRLALQGQAPPAQVEALTHFTIIGF